MKNSFYLFLLFLGFTGPLSSQSINESTVKKHIYTLANDSMQGRKAGTEGIEKAAKYIESQFKKIGLKYFNNNSFRQTFKYKNKRSRNQEELNLFNVIGFLEGNEKKDEIVVISAHYDHRNEIFRGW
jgi:acetylornithine deacetylase/succinyl-diaminopimelate desuccinylase-like protein